MTEVQIQATDLVTLEGQETDLTYFNQVEAGLATLENKYAIVPDAFTKEGWEAIRAGLAEMRPLRVAVDKRRKDTGKKLRAKLKEINDIGNGIIARIKTVEGPFKQAKQDAEEAEARKEAQRIATIQADMQKIKDAYDESEGKPSTTITRIMDKLTQGYYLSAPEDFQEFQAAADELKNNIMIKLQARYQRTVESEQYAEEQRVEAEKLKEERALLKIEEEARQAEAEEERARVAALEAEAKAKIAEVERKAEEDRLEAEALREHEKTVALARERELQLALEAMKKQQDELIAKQKAADQAIIDKENADKLEHARQLKKEANEKAEAERLEAEAAEEAKRVQAEAIAKATQARTDAKIAAASKKEAVLALRNEVGMSELMANTTINHIQLGKIPHIKWVD